MIAGITRNFILCLFIATGCTGSSLHESQMFREYRYSSINDWNSIQQKTIMVDTWFNSAMDTSVYLSQPRGIVQVSEDKFWVSDVMLGGIYEFNSQGKYSHQERIHNL